MSIVSNIFDKVSGRFIEKGIKKRDEKIFLQKCFEESYSAVGQIYGPDIELKVKSYTSTESIRENIISAFENIEPNLTLSTFDSRDLEDQGLRNGLNIFVMTFIQEMKKNHEISNTVAHKQQSDQMYDLTQVVGKMGLQLNDLSRHIVEDKKDIRFENKVESKSILDKFNIPYKLNNIVEINGDDQEIQFHFTVRYDEKLKQFKSIEEIAQFSYFNQEEVNLQVVSFSMIVDNRPIVTNVNHLYVGETLTFAIYKEGTFKIAKEFIDNNTKGIIMSELKIIPPKPEVEMALDIYDFDMECIMRNVKFSLYKSGYIDENTIRKIFCNISENDLFSIALCVDIRVYSKDFIDIREEDIKVKLDVTVKDMTSVESVVAWLDFLKASIKGEMTIKDHKSKAFFAQGMFTSSENLETINDEYEVMKKLRYIERKLCKTFIVKPMDYEEIENIESVYDTLRKGKCRTGSLNISIPYENMQNIDEESIGNAIQYISDFNGLSCTILNESIDLGSGVLIQEEAVIKEIDEGKVLISSTKSERNFLVVHNFYGTKSRDDVLKKEGLWDYSKSSYAPMK